MSHEAHGKRASDPAHHDDAHAPAHASVGKQPGTAQAPQPADGGAVAEAASASTAHLKKTVREKYMPDLHVYKDTAIEEMRDNFLQGEQVGNSFLGNAIKGVAAGAGAALAGALGGGVLVTALGAALGDLGGSIANGFGTRGARSPNDFVSHYKNELQRHYRVAVDKMMAAMDAGHDDAKAIHTQMKTLDRNEAIVRREMRQELLDAWTNAQRYKTMGPVAGMGGKSFNDPTAGRLHLGTFLLDIEDKHARPLTTPSTKASMPGVPGPAARNENLHRPLSDMRIARTVRVHWNGYGVHGDVNLGVDPSGHRVDQLAAADALDKFAMASWFVGRRLDRDDVGPLEGKHDQNTINANWQNGMQTIWDFLRDKTVAQLHIHQVDASNPRE